MARFLNPNGAPFKESLRTRIYEDKSAMIEFINQQICTRDKYICVSRPRRFGKSMALDMLAAYYCLGRDYKELFKDSDNKVIALYRVCDDDKSKLKAWKMFL